MKNLLFAAALLVASTAFAAVTLSTGDAGASSCCAVCDCINEACECVVGGPCICDDGCCLDCCSDGACCVK